jgi:proteasome assembly chaperone (PAC2) family protein
VSRARIVWYGGAKKFPKNDLMLHAVPGVGNVGKLVTDSLVNTHDSTLVARILHPDLPPHATLNDGNNILTLSSNFQPLTPAGQYEVASSLLECCKEAKVGRLLILAGLSSEPGNDAVHVVCASEDDVKSITEMGIEVSKEHPAAGIIGMTGMVSSLAPTFNQPSACVIAATVGTSADSVAADRMVAFLKDSFNLDLGLELNNTKATAEKLMAFFDLDEIAEMPLDFENADPDAGFYA